MNLMTVFLNFIIKIQLTALTATSRGEGGKLFRNDSSLFTLIASKFVFIKSIQL